MQLLSFEDDAVSQELAEAIVNIIGNQCMTIEEIESRNYRDYPELYDEDYMKMRKHGFTASVYAGFMPNTIVPGASVSKRMYGRGHCQPEIESDSAVIQLYSSEASLDTKEIREKCERYNIQESDKKYVVFRFFTSKKGHLLKVELLHFNEMAEIISNTLIYQYQAGVISIA